MNTFNPDYAVHPGEILEEILDSRGVDKIDFSRKCGLSICTINRIIAGKVPVTPEIANRLEKALGVTAEIWTTLQDKWDMHRKLS